MRENENINSVQGNTEIKSIYDMGLFEKMAAITAELGTVAKNLEVKAGNTKYNAVSERDILDAVKPLEEKYGIYSYPCDREILESEILQSESTYNNQTTTKTSFFSRIKTTYRFVDIDHPSDFIDMVTFAEGIDPQDKGSGKAMTYADKYALMKAYKISTGDDPDNNPSNPENYQKQGKGSSRQPQTPPPMPPRYQGPQQGWQNPPAPQEPICDECNQAITDTPRKDGGIMTKWEVVKYSEKNFNGAILCPSCQKKILKGVQEE
jgi:hypothetical protein